MNEENDSEISADELDSVEHSDSDGEVDIFQNIEDDYYILESSFSEDDVIEDNYITDNEGNAYADKSEPQKKPFL